MTISSNLLAMSSENGERLRLSTFGTKIGNPGFSLGALGDVIIGDGLLAFATVIFEGFGASCMVVIPPGFFVTFLGYNVTGLIAPVLGSLAIIVIGLLSPPTIIYGKKLLEYCFSEKYFFKTKFVLTLAWRRF